MSGLLMPARAQPRLPGLRDLVALAASGRPDTQRALAWQQLERDRALAHQDLVAWCWTCIGPWFATEIAHMHSRAEPAVRP